MYDFPEVHGAHDTVWTHIARRLEEAGIAGVPARLDRTRGTHALWSDPALLLSQCCGADLVGGYAGRLDLLATPRYRAPGCDGCHYSSVVIVAEESAASELAHLRGAVCVVNGHESHSGTNALRALIAPLARQGRFFSRVIVSGSHPASVAAVAKGEAAVAAIDAVTYAHLERYRPASLEGTRRLCYTERAPGIPFVTRSGGAAERVGHLQRALVAAFEEREVRAAAADMFIDGVEILPLCAYERIDEFKRRAGAEGYPALR